MKMKVTIVPYAIEMLGPELTAVSSSSPQMTVITLQVGCHYFLPGS